MQSECIRIQKFLVYFANKKNIQGIPFEIPKFLSFQVKRKDTNLIRECHFILIDSLINFNI